MSGSHSSDYDIRLSECRMLCHSGLVLNVTCVYGKGMSIVGHKILNYLDKYWLLSVKRSTHISKSI